MGRTRPRAAPLLEAARERADDLRAVARRAATAVGRVARERRAGAPPRRACARSEGGAQHRVGRRRLAARGRRARTSRARGRSRSRWPRPEQLAFEPKWWKRMPSDTPAVGRRRPWSWPRSRARRRGAAGVEDARALVLGIAAAHRARGHAARRHAGARLRRVRRRPHAARGSIRRPPLSATR